jgi:hypothetical protein
MKQFSVILVKIEWKRNVQDLGTHVFHNSIGNLIQLPHRLVGNSCGRYLPEYYMPDTQNSIGSFGLGSDRDPRIAGPQRMGLVLAMAGHYRQYYLVAFFGVTGYGTAHSNGFIISMRRYDQYFQLQTPGFETVLSKTVLKYPSLSNNRKRPCRIPSSLFPF